VAKKGILGSNGSSAYEKTFLGIAITVAAVWAIATLVQVAFPSHVVPLSVNAIMGTVATSFFGGAFVAGRRRREAAKNATEEDPK
jgi:hypothetical protein